MRLPKNVAPALAELAPVARDVITQRMRAAKLPEVYRALVDQMKQCETVLEITYFSDAAEALVAYAKIHNDNKLFLQARRLKIWAAWAAGRAAEKLRPANEQRDHGKFAMRGPNSVLREHGFSRATASAIVRISRVDEAVIVENIEGPNVPGFSRISRLGKSDRPRFGGSVPLSPAATEILGTSPSGGKYANLSMHASFCRSTDATTAQTFTPPEVARARELLREIQEWHDAFEQHLPKGERRQQPIERAQSLGVA